MRSTLLLLILILSQPAFADCDKSFLDPKLDQERESLLVALNKAKKDKNEDAWSLLLDKHFKLNGVNYTKFKQNVALVYDKELFAFSVEGDNVVNRLAAFLKKKYDITLVHDPEAYFSKNTLGYYNSVEKYLAISPAEVTKLSFIRSTTVFHEIRHALLHVKLDSKVPSRFHGFISQSDRAPILGDAFEYNELLTGYSANMSLSELATFTGDFQRLVFFETRKLSNYDAGRIFTDAIEKRLEYTKAINAQVRGVFDKLVNRIDEAKFTVNYDGELATISVTLDDFVMTTPFVSKSIVELAQQYQEASTFWRFVSPKLRRKRELILKDIKAEYLKYYMPLYSGTADISSNLGFINTLLEEFKAAASVEEKKLIWDNIVKTTNSIRKLVREIDPVSQGHTE